MAAPAAWWDASLVPVLSDMGTAALIIVLVVLVPVMLVGLVAGLIATLHPDEERRSAARAVYCDGLFHVRQLLRPRGRKPRATATPARLPRTNTAANLVNGGDKDQAVPDERC